MVRISRRKLLTTGIGFLLVTSLIMPATTIAVPNQSPSSNGAPLPSIAPVETSSVAPEVMSQQSISGAIDAGTNLGDYLPSDMAKLKANLNSNGRNNPNVPAADTVDNGRALNNTEGIPTADAPALAASTWQSFAYTGWFPPDPTVAAGPSNIVASVNGGIRAFTKSGTQQWGYTLANFFPAAAICGSSTCSTSGWSVFDPWITYDNIGGRFVIVALTRNTSLQQARLIVAASKSNYTRSPPVSPWTHRPPRCRSSMESPTIPSMWWFLRPVFMASAWFGLNAEGEPLWNGSPSILPPESGPSSMPMEASRRTPALRHRWSRFSCWVQPTSMELTQHWRVRWWI